MLRAEQGEPLLDKLRQSHSAEMRGDGKGQGEPDLRQRTSFGEAIKECYTPAELPADNYERNLGQPGQYPFTRGIQADMYRGRLWSMRQYAGFATPAETNRRFKYLLAQGQTGLSVAFDLPTQMGYDSDHPLAEGEVGRVGVAVDSLWDLEEMLAGIPLDQVSTSMTINAPAAMVLAMYLAVAEKQGVSPRALNGTVQNDVLKEYVARGTYIFPPRSSLRLATEVISYCVTNLPRFNFISIGGYHIREAGANAVQEVAFAFAIALAYVDAALEAGLSIDSFAPRFSWIFNTQNNLFEEAAKYRAARRLWARLMREEYGAGDPRSWMFRTHVQDGGSTLTLQEPLNNLIRGTIHCLATALGGVQSMAISSYDEALGLPSEEAARLSLRVQQIVAWESGVTATVDPLAGSYYVEHLTNRIEEAVREELARIRAMGGAVAAIENGYLQGALEEAAYQTQRNIENGRQVVVGLNRFQGEAGGLPPAAPVNLEVEAEQVRRLKELRRRRDQGSVAAALEELKKAARGDGKLMEPLLAAVKAYATIGEMSEALRQVFGSYRPQDRAAKG